MEFRGNNPGAVQFGNFINYYQFNSAEDRLSLLPDHVWEAKSEAGTHVKSPYLVLDVGCNSGDLTQLVYDYLSRKLTRKICVLGVDIDPMLITRAKEANSTPNIEFQCVNVMNKDDFGAIEKYLTAQNAIEFDAVCCFSITMWIHLNHGDSGLCDFLQKCAAIGKLFVIEPQMWKCYRNASRRMKRSADECFPYYRELKWTTNVEEEIEKYLENDLHLSKVHETKRTNWTRKMCFYRRVDNPPPSK